MSQTKKTLKLGTRGSALAMAQAKAVAALLAPIATVEIVTIKTSGDAGHRERLGAFVSEIQRAVLDGEVDCGLHCLKDIPASDSAANLAFAAHLMREDPSDCVLTRGSSWLELPRSALVGTGSTRRTAQLASHRPDLRFQPLVGNVDSRMGKLMAGEYDAIVLAVAGLKRLGLTENWEESKYAALRFEPLSTSVVLPAPGQAILVLECRAEDHGTHDLLAQFNDPETELCARAERSFLARFGAGCSVPVAALATISDGQMLLHGLVGEPDGSRVIKGEHGGADGEADLIGLELAEKLGRQGAFEILAQFAQERVPAGVQR